MKQVIYFSYTSGKASAFREDAETVFDFSTAKSIAFIDSILGLVGAHINL